MIGSVANKRSLSNEYLGKVSRSFKDLSFNFSKHPITNDIVVLKNEEAIKQSVKNLLMTNRFEKPFDTTFGGNLNDFLFELETGDEAELIADNIIEAVELHEPRAQVINVDVNLRPDTNNVRITVVFEVLSVGETVTLDLNLTRLR
jgi:phage baseplate assembly protein W